MAGLEKLHNDLGEKNPLELFFFFFYNLRLYISKFYQTASHPCHPII